MYQEYVVMVLIIFKYGSYAEFNAYRQAKPNLILETLHQALHCIIGQTSALCTQTRH